MIVALLAESPNVDKLVNPDTLPPVICAFDALSRVVPTRVKLLIVPPDTAMFGVIKFPANRVIALMNTLEMLPAKISVLDTNKFATFSVCALPEMPCTVPPVIVTLLELKSVTLNADADPVMPFTEPLVILAVPLNVPLNVVALMVFVLGLKLIPGVIYAALFPDVERSVKLG